MRKRMSWSYKAKEKYDPSTKTIIRRGAECGVCGFSLAFSSRGRKGKRDWIDVET